MSDPSVYRIYFPSRDQAFGYLSAPVARTSFSSCEPSVFFKYRSKTLLRLEVNNTREPSGLHKGNASRPGSKVRRLAGPRCKSYIQISVFWLPTSVLSTATDCPFADRTRFEYTSGSPTVPTSVPLRSNQASREKETLPPFCTSSRPESETA